VFSDSRHSSYLCTIFYWAMRTLLYPGFVDGLTL